jgi:hypothetical protein
MARTWLGIKVELVEGRGAYFWPRPGRVFAAARSHTFALLAHSIDVAFGRWDFAHSHGFTLSDGTAIGTPDPEWAAQEALDEEVTTLSRLRPGEVFAYEFDFGDGWTHLCTVLQEKVDPLDVLGIAPDEPLAYWGGGSLPDQYGRRWLDDEGRSPGKDPQARDLPPIHPGWGPRR